MTHRVTHKRIRRSAEEVYHEGDEIDATEAELSAFGDRLEEIDDGDDDSEEADPPPEDDGVLPFNPEDNTNDEVEEKVADIDDEETLRALLNLEQDQKDRDGATEAIEERIDEVTE